MSRTIVLDLRLPTRRKQDLEAKPNEGMAFIARLHEMQSDTSLKAGWARLLGDYEADDVWLQAYRQDPRHPFVHKKPHVSRAFKGDGGGPAPDPANEPEQVSGRSGLVVATLHLPRRPGTGRSESDLATQTDDFLARLEDLLGSRVRAHGREYGYGTLNARGEEYSDLNAVKHNSLSFSASASCDFGAISMSGEIGFSVGL
jgi:hypothetical protein